MLGIPVRVIHEAEGQVVTVEINTGEIYRGVLEGAEDNMNVMLTGVLLTGRDGKVTPLEQVYLRGSKIRYFILPDMLRHAPMFRKIDGRGMPTNLKMGRGWERKGGRGGRGGGGRGRGR
eukprot:TRINITY_DN1301_c1_g1_i1.p1 TRINITY_DN1301_c1_g1~~TRINITY_DN1301_c1_g1_i1.p1  ORF type:complete len:119 (-),score=47.25 TRINITY_DN1301_c1_g1_i1:29-385(-)